jgi:hypothetical protein
VTCTVTDKFIPLVSALVGAVRPEDYYLSRSGRALDGEPITADDWVFTYEMLQSPHIVDPFYNVAMEETYESVDKIDDYTLGVVGAAKLAPWSITAGCLSPSHRSCLDESWVTRTTNEPQIAVRLYRHRTERGTSVTFKRVPNWWGDPAISQRVQFRRDRLRVILPGAARLLRLSELDMMIEGTARNWNDSTFPPLPMAGLLRGCLSTCRTASQPEH